VTGFECFGALSGKSQIFRCRKDDLRAEKAGFTKTAPQGGELFVEIALIRASYVPAAGRYARFEKPPLPHFGSPTADNPSQLIDC